MLIGKPSQTKAPPEGRQGAWDNLSVKEGKGEEQLQRILIAYENHEVMLYFLYPFLATSPYPLFIVSSN